MLGQSEKLNKEDSNIARGQFAEDIFQIRERTGKNDKSGDQCIEPRQWTVDKFLVKYLNSQTLGNRLVYYRDRGKSVLLL